MHRRKQEQQRHLKSFDEDPKLEILNGRYGPYIKHDGKNFRIPKGYKAENITMEDCKKFIAGGPTGSARPSFRKFSKK